jgi:hypothetical protein
VDERPREEIRDREARLDVAYRVDSSAAVALDGSGVALGGAIGVETRVAAGTALAQKIPHAVELDADVLETGVLSGAQGAAAMAFEQAVLLGDKRLDVILDGPVGTHRASL